jgi:malonyl-CoA decarboxylase
MTPISLVNWMTAVADRGRALLDVPPLLAAHGNSLQALCRDLMGRRGEATSTAIAREIANLWWRSSAADRLGFFRELAERYNCDAAQVLAAASAYAEAPGPKTHMDLVRRAEPPRQELLRRINHAPGGTKALVNMREVLLGLLPEHSELAAVDADFKHLLTSWFNRGFLELRSISWDTPASILEKLIRYEAVHEITGWADLRRRLEHDRRCFAFFHPAIPDEPLVFVEVALTTEISQNIAGILHAPVDAEAEKRAATAIFYSISNCQRGLSGVSFGNFLIKQVVDELRRAVPSLRAFATLSPIPGFATWLSTHEPQEPWLAELQGALPADPEPHLLEPLRKPLMKACACYLLTQRRPGVPLDPVARFHLGNGAQLRQLNWLADTSPKGLRQSLGMMVNYAYDLDSIERNHERLVDLGEISVARAVRALADQKL